MAVSTSTKPYLIRAIHEWCCDNGYRPYLAVAVDAQTIVPREFVRDGEIVLNVSVDATNRLRLGNDLIEFEARFGGVARQVSIPIGNVSAIYSAENGHGMAFEVERPDAGEAAERRAAGEGEGEGEGEAASTLAPAAPGPVLGIVPVEPPQSSPAGLAPSRDGNPAADADAPDEPVPPTPPAGRPKLTRIK